MDNEVKVAVAVLSLLAAQAFVLGSAFYVWLIRIGNPTRTHVGNERAAMAPQAMWEPREWGSRTAAVPPAAPAPHPIERDDDVVLPRAA